MGQMGTPPKGMTPESRALWALADDLGYELVRTTNRGHHRIKHTVTGKTAMISNNVTLEGRAFKNSDAMLRRGAVMETLEEATIAPAGWPEAYDNVVAFANSLGWHAEQQVNGNLRFTNQAGHSVTLPKPDLRVKDPNVHWRTTRDWTERVLIPATPLESRLELAAYIDRFGKEAVAEASLNTAEVTTVAPKAPKQKTEKVVANSEAEVPRPPLVEVRRPWMATRGRGTYESKAVEEITVDSGGEEPEVIAYGCTKCDARADTPHFIASHYKRAHSFRKGRAEQNPTTGAVTDYHPTQRLLDALADFLDARWHDGMDAQEMALAALQWMHLRPDLPEPSGHEPLTDAQIVERIRRLVGAGQVSQEEHEAALEEINGLRLALETAQQEVTRLQSDIDAWLSLAPRPVQGA